MVLPGRGRVRVRRRQRVASAEFADAVEALCPVAYKLKFASKQDLGRDYVVMPLEGLWWSTDMETFTTARDKVRWDWTIMSMVSQRRPTTNRSRCRHERRRHKLRPQY